MCALEFDTKTKRIIVTEKLKIMKESESETWTIRKVEAHIIMLNRGINRAFLLSLEVLQT